TVTFQYNTGARSKPYPMPRRSGLQAIVLTPRIYKQRVRIDWRIVPAGVGIGSISAKPYILVDPGLDQAASVTVETPHTTRETAGRIDNVVLKHVAMHV